MSRLSLIAICFISTCPPAALLAEEKKIADRTQSEWIKILRTDEKARMREGAVVALSLIGPKERGVIEAFREAMLNDKAERVRLKAVTLAGDFDKDLLRSLIQPLAEVLTSDKSATVRTAAARALGRTGEYAKTATNAIIDGLKDSDPVVRAAVAEAIGRIGEEAKGAVPQLIALLKDGDANVRLAAVFALGRVGPVAAKAVPELSTVLAADADATVRKEAARAFGFLGFEAKEGVPALAKSLREDKADDVRQHAALALGKMGLDVKPAIPALLDAMRKDADKAVRIYSVTALGNSLGSRLKDYVADLADLLVKEPEGDVRLAIVQELGALGPNAKDALPALNRAVADVQITVRDAAKAAVKKVMAKP